MEDTEVRGRSQIMSATEGRGGFRRILTLVIFACSESKLTCHFFIVVLLVVAKRSIRSEKGRKRLLSVDQR